MIKRSSKYLTAPVGAIFHGLTVLGAASKAGDFGRPKWRFRCFCGQEVVRAAMYVALGMTKSCGCLQRERAGSFARHGMSDSAEYTTWQQMKNRCLNEASTQFENYGARGITVCDRWLVFENFIADMGCKPTPQHTIGRKDNDGDYEPDNCEWQTLTEQGRNRRRPRPSRRYTP